MGSRSHIRPLSIGELLDLAFRLCRARILILAGITALPLIPVFLLEIIFLFSNDPSLATFSNLVLQIVRLLSQGFISIALVAAISRIYLQKTLTLRDAYRDGAAKFGTYVLAAILMSLAIGAPLVALVMCSFLSNFSEGLSLLFSATVLLIGLPLIVFVRTRWAVVIPAIILDDFGASGSLGRSFNLTSEYFWRVFGTSTLAGILVWLITWLPQIAVMFIFESMASRDVIETIATMVGEITLVITAPLSMAVTTLIYYDLRIRKEGFDLQVSTETAQEIVDEILPDDA